MAKPGEEIQVPLYIGRLLDISVEGTYEIQINWVGVTDQNKQMSIVSKPVTIHVTHDPIPADFANVSGDKTK